MQLNELYQEEKGGTFTHDGEDYDLNMVLTGVDHYPTVLFFVNDLTWVFAYDKPNAERSRAAQTKFPILVTYFEDNFVVIDGLHRLKHAVSQGKRVIIGKFVPDDVLKKARIDQ